MTEAQRSVAVDAEKFAYWCAWRWMRSAHRRCGPGCRPPLGIDDAIGAALLALCRAAAAWRPEDGSKFSVYAAKWIFGGIKKAADAARALRLEQLPLVESDGGSQEMELADPKSLEGFDRADDRDACRRALSRLRPEDAEMCRRIDMDGESMESVAASRGCTPQAVYYRMERIRARLRGERDPGIARRLKYRQKATDSALENPPSSG